MGLTWTKKVLNGIYEENRVSTGSISGQNRVSTGSTYIGKWKK